jgi:ligand-binding sensor domain-containing protein
MSRLLSKSNICRIWGQACLLSVFLMIVFAYEIPAASQQEFKVLISNSIRSVAADAGSIWIATDRGVSRFSQRDGRWTSYTKDDGLVSDNVHVVTSDGDEVWFGTDNGVSRYKPNENEWITYRERDGLVSNKINCITQDVNYVWIGTDKGLARFDTNISSWAARTQEDGLTTNLVTSIAVEKDSVWAGTEARRRRHSDDWGWREDKRRSGLNRYDKNTDSWNTYTPEEGLMSGQVSTIAADEDTVWIGTSDAGISCYSKKDQAFVKSYSKSEILDTNNIKSILVDGIYTWIGTANRGVYRYIKTTDTWMQYTFADGLASDHVTSIAVSGDEVWFGSNENGLSKYNKLTQKWTRYVKASYPADNDVRWIQVDGDQVWAATARGLSRYVTGTDQWTTYGVKDGLTEEYITCMEISESSVFIPTANGLAKLDRETGKWRFYTDFIDSSSFVTALEAAESLLIGTIDAGVFTLPLQGEGLPESMLTPDQLPGSGVTYIESNGGEVWIGTDGGFFLFNMEGQSGKAFTQADGLASDHVNAAVQDGDDLWIGTTGGLSRYNRSDSSWLTFTSQDGLPGDNVRALAVADDGKLWAGTSRGLALLSSTSEAEYEIRTALFSESGSSFYNNIRSIAIAGDTLWLATAAGILKFSPSTGEWWEHRAEPRKTPFIESEVTTIQFDGTDVWVSNWNSSAFGCIAKFDTISRSWLRYTSRDILSTQPDEKVTTITTVSKIIPEAHHVWFTTDWGILKYNKELDTWRHYTTADGLVDNNVRYLVLGGGTAWASSSGQKINRYDEKNDEWLTMRFQLSGGGMEEKPIERDGEWRLEDMERREQEDRWSSVRDLIVDDGSIWLRMGDGITFFNQYTKELRRFTVEDGMASDRVRCLEYDGRYVWVGHESDEHAGMRGGISRYDTVAGEWTSYTDTNILADDRIDRILVSKELVWFLPDRHSRSGATGYDVERDNWFILKPKADSDSEDGNMDNRFEGGIIEVVSDRENIWVGSMRSGLLQFHTASDSWRFLSDGDNVLNNIVMREGLKVDENSVWVGTMGGLRLFNKELETWTTYTKPVSLTGNEVRAIAADDRYVWCGTNQGISRYDKIEGVWTHFQSKGGRIEIKIGNESWEWWREESNEGLMDNSITGLAADDRYLWITTQRGANRYDKTANIWDRYSQQNGLPTNSITSVAADGSDVWLSTSKGLCRYPGMSDDPNAWVTYTSMIEIRPMVFSQEYASSLVSNKIRTIAAEKDYIWAGTERGVSRYDKRQDTWQTFTHEDGLIDDKVSCIAVDKDNVWFGTAKGVTKFSRETRDWITFTTRNGLPSDQVTCIAIDGSSIWFGFFDAGLARYDESPGSEESKAKDSWTRFTESDGLAHNSVLSMTVDGDFIWIGTRRGLTRYDKRTETWTTYREY